MPAPIVGLHVAKGGIDSALYVILVTYIIAEARFYLCCDGVRAGGKQLGNARCLEPSLRESEGRAQTGTPGANHHRIICVINDCVRLSSESVIPWIRDHEEE